MPAMAGNPHQCTLSLNVTRTRGRRAHGVPGRAAERRAAGRERRGAAARAVAAAAHAAAAGAAAAPPAPAGAPAFEGVGISFRI